MPGRPGNANNMVQRTPCFLSLGGCGGLCIVFVFFVPPTFCTVFGSVSRGGGWGPMNA